MSGKLNTEIDLAVNFDFLKCIVKNYTLKYIGKKWQGPSSKTCNKSSICIFMVFSKSRLKFPDAFRHSVIKPHNICTKQLVSSIAFECTFPNYCTESSKKNFLINPCLVHHSGFDIVPICICLTNWYIANLYFLNFNLFNTFWSWHICILAEKKLILITYIVK